MSDEPEDKKTKIVQKSGSSCIPPDPNPAKGIPSSPSIGAIVFSPWIAAKANSAFIAAPCSFLEKNPGLA